MSNTTKQIIARLASTAKPKLRAAVDIDMIDEFTDLLKCLDSVKWQSMEDQGAFDDPDSLYAGFKAESMDALIKRLESEGYKVMHEVDSAPAGSPLEGATDIRVLGYGSGNRCPLAVGLKDNQAILWMPEVPDDKTDTFTRQM